MLAKLTNVPPNTDELCEILEAFMQVRNIRDTGVLSPQQRDHPLFKSAFTEVIIYARDLLEKSERRGTRITFSDDIEIDKYCHDVSDLIRLTRDAICHLDSRKRETGHGKAAFLVISGIRAPEILMGFKISCSYPDDARIYYGHRGIYLNRHLFRAFDEAIEALCAFDSIIKDVVEFFRSTNSSVQGSSEKFLEFIRNYPNETVVSVSAAQNLLHLFKTDQGA